MISLNHFGNKYPVHLGIKEILIIVFFIGTCSETRNPILKDNAEFNSGTIKIFQSVQNDKNGFPKFENEIKDKLLSKDNKYVIVYYSNSKPAKSFNLILLSPEEIELDKPFRIILKNTGNGLDAGIDIASSMRFGGVSSDWKRSSDSGTAIAQLVVITFPVVLGVFTGATIGIIKSIPEFGNQIAKVFDSDKERVYSYTLYHYDDQERLSSYSIFLPAEKNFLTTKITFSYKANSKIPFKSKIERI